MTNAQAARNVGVAVLLCIGVTACGGSTNNAAHPAPGDPQADHKAVSAKSGSDDLTGGATPPTTRQSVPAESPDRSTPGVTGTRDATGASSPPCSLLTTADIATFTGVPMTVAGGDGLVTCAYLSTDHTRQLTVQILADRPAMRTLLQLESSGEHIDGLGDDAFWSSAGIVFVRVGDRAFALSSPSFGASTNPDAPKAGMTLLATHALSKF